MIIDSTACFPITINSVGIALQRIGILNKPFSKSNLILLFPYPIFNKQLNKQFFLNKLNQRSLKFLYSRPLYITAEAEKLRIRVGIKINFQINNHETKKQFKT